MTSKRTLQAKEQSPIAPLLDQVLTHQCAWHLLRKAVDSPVGDLAVLVYQTYRLQIVGVGQLHSQFPHLSLLLHKVYHPLAFLHSLTGHHHRMSHPLVIVKVRIGVH